MLVLQHGQQWPHREGSGTLYENVAVNCEQGRVPWFVHKFSPVEGPVCYLGPCLDWRFALVAAWVSEKLESLTPSRKQSAAPAKWRFAACWCPVCCRYPICCMFRSRETGPRLFYEHSILGSFVGRWAQRTCVVFFVCLFFVELLHV